LRRLRQWFGRLTLGQLDYRVLEKWQTQRLTGLLGSGRNPNRGNDGAQDDDPKPLAKHQRHWRKTPGKELPCKQVYPVSTQTARHELVLLRRAIQSYFKLQRLMLWHGMWLQTHYLMQMNLPAAADPRDRRLSDEEVTAVLSRLDALPVRSAVLFALLTTLRCSEIVSLR
jgi:integrase